jgi:hypothetical protein
MPVINTIVPINVSYPWLKHMGFPPASEGRIASISLAFMGRLTSTLTGTPVLEILRVVFGSKEKCSRGSISE